MTATKRISSLDFGGFQAIKMVLENLATEPAGPNSVGQVYYNTISNSIGVCVGAGSPGTWAYLGTGSYSDEAAQDALNTAFAAGSHTGLTITYDDSTNKFSFAVNGITSAMITDGTITDTDVAAANKDGGAGTASMRTIGTGAAQAMAGNTRLDSIAAPTADVSFNTHKATNIVDGTNPQDAATFGQLSSILEGKTFKDPVAFASTGNLALSGLAAVDGYTPVAGERVLVKDQTSHAADGVYITAAGAWTRATDMNGAAEATKGASVLVLNGTANKGDVFTQGNAITTLGTDAMAWTKTADTNVVYTADEATLTLVGTQFAVKALGIDNGSISTTAAIAYGKLALANSIVNADIAAAAAIDRSKLAGAYTATIGNGASTSIAVAHNLGSKAVQVQVYRTASPYDDVDCYFERTDTNTVTFKPDVAPSAGEYTVVITL